MSTNAMDWPDSSCARPDIYFASLEGIIEACLCFAVSFAFFICLSNKKIRRGNLSWECHIDGEGALNPIIQIRNISLAAVV
ncbi:hypothetical protein [Roseibium sp.]|uniref:hypothetical protein n=1 Tax=Roseibium sp. TaxID=1936156 RepID=UPI003BB210E7